MHYCSAVALMPVALMFIVALKILIMCVYHPIFSHKNFTVLAIDISPAVSKNFIGLEM